MCGLAGIVSFSSVNQGLYDALTVLQHRGQDAAGILTSENGIVHLKKGNGLVRDVFHRKDMNALAGNMGIGHVRYPTAGSSSSDLAQPFYVNSPYGISLAHNGNLTNTHQLSKELFEDDLRHVNTSSDSKVLLNIFAHELQQIGKHKPTENDFFKAVEGVQRRCKGGYAVVCLIVGHGLIAFRDPNGIRPLIYGKRESEQGTEYMVASESVALDTQGFEIIDDVMPGGAVFFDLKGNMHSQQCTESKDHTPCIFEHVYFSRPDSIMDGISVYKSRLRMGEKLAAQIKEEWPDHDIDVVVPIPDTARTCAIPLAHKLDVKFREGLIKNRYIGRTFIMPGQTERKKSVRQKLNAIRLEFEGKNVLLVDDSIVRGTTCKQIIQMARDAGAKNVYFASAAPAVRFPNVYGIDMPAATELIAHDRSTEEIRQLIGADKLIYLNIEHLIECAREGNPAITQFECSVFTGEYVTADIDTAYLARIEADRNDLQKQKNETG
ncbi:MAG: amidophosphoribosyltransferase [Pseudomonadales bacterium]|nr:amidophosphoribosyltransferase [Pseudomonadales bacterium]